MQTNGIAKRKLGNSGLEVAPLIFGANVFGWTVGEAEGIRLLDHFVASGFNMVDTADVYSNWIPGNRGGESETIIGKWLNQSGKRNQVMVATKLGVDMGGGRKGLSKKYILEAVEESLGRLQTDYIDLYQSHTPDRETPQEETLEAYAALIRSGKVRSIGASNFSSETLREALEISRQTRLPRYETLQPHYNLYEREGFEGPLEALCRENAIGVIPYYSLAGGFLTGKYRSHKDLQNRSRGARVEKYLNPRGFRILAALDQLAKEHARKPGQIALAWLLAKPAITAPIASATSIDQLEELLAATRMRLSEGDLEKLDRASAYWDEEPRIA
jgi:aryl-alcohol dehydrogenase-like predicted oxidoreductase